jgi:hypothetical protein
MDVLACPSSGSANILWGRIIQKLVTDSSSHADPTVICGAITTFFPAAVPAAGRYLAFLDEHPDLTPTAPSRSLRTVFDVATTPWPPQFLESVDAQITQMALSTLPLGAKNRNGR